MSGVGLSLRLFGPLTVRIAGQPLPPLRARTGLKLLALLTLRAGRPVERLWLAGTLWPDSPDTVGLGNLRRTLTDLRAALGPEARRLEAPDPATLRLDLAGADVDLTAFDDAAARGRRGEGDGWEAVAALHTGPLLEGWSDDWLLAERDARVQTYRAGLEALADAARRRGDSEATEAWLRRLVADDPLRESAWRRLMRALAERGDHSAAQRAYRDLRERLRQAGAGEPSPETIALHRSLLAAPTAAPPQAAAGNLPRPLTRLVGRRQEAERVQALLRRSRLVTLTGTGGIGKTRLALEVAETVAAEFPDGAWFVDLSAATAPEGVAAALRASLGLAETKEPAEHLAARTALLLVDNCEQVADASARLLQPLLAACPNLRAVATSRRPLGVPGETTYRVPSLSLPGDARPDAPDKRALLDYEAPRLFVERALAADPDFTLHPHEAPLVAQIVRRLDGIPLAIELAAARTRLLSLEQIAARLDDRFRLLVSRTSAALPRQQTLRAALDWSWELLDADGRGLLARLSVFHGGWTLAAMESVCDGALEQLAVLVDDSLVSADPGAGGEKRYRLLETIRQYAAERGAEDAPPEARRTLRDRHLRHFADWADGLRRQFQGPTEGEALARIDADLENLRAALHHADGTLEQARLTVALHRFWLVRGHVREGSAWLDAAIRSAAGDDPDAVRWRAEALGQRAGIAFVSGDYDRAIAAAEAALELLPDGPQPRASRATALNTLAQSWSARGDQTRARSLYAQALAIRRALDDRAAVADILGNLGYCAEVEGDWSAARAHYAESLEIDRALGNARGVAWSLCHLGQICHHPFHESEKARAMLDEALAIFQTLGHRRMTAVCQAILGEWAVLDGDLGRGAGLLNEALVRMRAHDCRLEIVQTLEAVAHLALAQGSPERSVRILAAAQTHARALGAVQAEANRTEVAALEARQRAALPAEAYADARARGQRMTFDETLDDALS